MGWEMKMILWRGRKMAMERREWAIKKWQRIENRWEMKYIRTPGARSRGYDLSRHTVVPHWAGGSKQDGERGERQRGGGWGKEGVTKKEKRGRAAGQTYNFSWEEPMSIYQKQHPTQNLCLSIRAQKVLPQAADTQFADVGTIRSDTKCGN